MLRSQGMKTRPPYVGVWGSHATGKRKSADCNPQALSGPLSALVNKALSTPSHGHSFMHCVWLLPC